jgi:hypothetical protein
LPYRYMPMPPLFERAILHNDGADAPLACPHAGSCEMFSLLQAAGTLKTWQIRYCAGEYHTCARYRLSQEGQPVPQNLLPSGQLLRFAANKGA